MVSLNVTGLDLNKSIFFKITAESCWDHGGLMILLKAVANLTVYRSDHTSPCCLPKEWLQELVSLQVRVVCMEFPNLPLPERSDSNLLTRQALPEVFYLSILMLVKLQEK